MMEKLRRENIELKKEREQARIAKSKVEKKREEKVHAELLARDAARVSEKSNEHASKLKHLYRPKDSSKNCQSLSKKLLQKGAPQAKRSRDDVTHPVTAEPPHYKSGLG